MAELKLNPNYKPELGATPANQQYVFSDPNQIINPQTGQTAITAASLEPVKPIEIPKVPTDNTNYAGIITGGASEVDMIAKQMADRAAEVKAEAEARAKEQGGIDIEALLKKYGGQAPPSGADIYQSTYGVGSTQAEVSALEQNKITTAGIVKSAQNEFNAINAQIQSINLASQARNLQLEKQISGGGTLTAGSGEVLSRQQTESNRQAAIESLPLQGQALVAQAKILVAQNDAETASQILNLAKQKMDTLFNLKITDAQNLYNYNKEIRNRVWDYLTEKEKTQLAALQKEDDRKFDLLKLNMASMKDLSKTALENQQGDLAAQIIGLNPASETFTADLAKLQEQIKPKPAVTTDITEYNLAKSQGYTGTLLDWQTKQANLKAKTITPIPETITPEKINNTLYSVGIPLTAVSSKGQITDSQLTKLQAGGIPPTDAQEIMDKILAPTELKDVRQWMRDLGVDPKVLDTFMMTLQGVKSGGGEEIINPFK